MGKRGEKEEEGRNKRNGARSPGNIHAALGPPPRLNRRPLCGPLDSEPFSEVGVGNNVAFGGKRKDGSMGGKADGIVRGSEKREEDNAHQGC